MDVSFIHRGHHCFLKSNIMPTMYFIFPEFLILPDFLSPPPRKTESKLILVISGNPGVYMILNNLRVVIIRKRHAAVKELCNINVFKLLLCWQHWCAYSFPLIILELNNSTKSIFPMEYLKLKENFQKSNSAKWPLPSCKKSFRVFEGKLF